MIKLIIFFIVFNILTSKGDFEVIKGPVYYQIIAHVPEKKEQAIKLATLIRKAAKEYEVDKKLLTAILIQESRLELEAINCHTNGCDFGVSQINWKTAKKMNISIPRLLTDLEYSIISGARVLADFKRMYGKTDKEYWTRFHSPTLERREGYKQLVMRFM